MKNNNHIFLLPVMDRWLLYAPLHKLTAVINRAAADQLRAGQRPRASELAGLYDTFVDRPVAYPEPPAGDPCPSFLGLIPTRGCNIGCVYCSFGGPTAERTLMDPRIAVAAIDWMAERLARRGRKIFTLHFFGGEPFVAPEIVDVVVHRTRYVCAQKGLVPYFDASTNGVFDQRRCRFVGDYFGGVVLSFDGPPEFHDRNRPAFQGRPTFDIVERTARRLSRMPLDLCLRVCITHDSVGHMEEITRWMCEAFRPAVINFETLTPGELASKAGLRVPDPYEFATHCVGAYRVAQRHGIRAVYSAAETEKARLSFCPVGTDALIVSLDGRVSACYLLPEDWRARGLDMDLGWVRPDGEVTLDFDALTRARRLPVDKPRCRGCFCQWSCAGGCHVNHTYPGCESAYDDFCLQTRLVTACLLLGQMGLDALVDELLADRSAMERLARHPWDAVALEPRGAERPAAEEAPSFDPPSRRPRPLVAEGLTLLG